MASIKRLTRDKELVKKVFREGERKITHNGYVLVRYKGDEGSFLILEHRLLFLAMDIEIPDGYEVHHRDLNKSNNHISNLQIMSHDEHVLLHQGLLGIVSRLRRKELVTV